MCLYKLKGTNSTCTTEQFRVLTDGTDDILNRGKFYCGIGHVNETSKSNSMTFGKSKSKKKSLKTRQ